ncbi:hypothetical protein P22_3817 [Propionispora sp. 2/2-37]|uniref:DUF3794 domain-containing protein n=1 Tax=Propionispora sp. 2/2-37 TaxID=1677858 RepID=UPI0006BB6617|nr:DUF3794 domain-containing protein [Propionispora sp. 2/2-37]CUH97682.1 hypothetical protein P22_3817 [Propionispora sp. 2/2-37]
MKRRASVYQWPYYGGGYYPPQPMMVQQLVGRRQAYKSMNVCLYVPRRKPSIDQVINTYVHHLCITSVEVVPDRVIVCGHFEVKVLYVACLPSQPVHAVESRRVRFTESVYIPGACYGMQANANVRVDYVDADCCRSGNYHNDYYDNYYWDYGYPHSRHGGSRSCDVTVSLRISASVFGDKEIMHHPHPGGMPFYPGGMPLHPKG